MRAGIVVVIAGLATFMLVLSPAVPAWFSVPTFALAGLGMGLAYAPLTLIVLREAPPHEQGSASSALSLTDALGTALGTGLTGASWPHLPPDRRPRGGPCGRLRDGDRGRCPRARAERPVATRGVGPNVSAPDGVAPEGDPA